jgi:hypothetical protein
MGKKIQVDVTELGRRGGRARATKLGPKKLRAAGRKAANARWEKYYREHPEKKRPGAE